MRDIKATLTFRDVEQVSTLLGLVRMALDECHEQMHEKISESWDFEQRRWFIDREKVLLRLERRLNAAGAKIS